MVKNEKEQLQETELHEKMLGYFESSLKHPMWVNYLKNAQNDFEFYEGEQWTATEKKELSDRGQPDTVQNEIKPFIDKVKGQYTQQRTRIGFVGRNPQADEELGNIFSDLALYVQQKADYEYEEKDTFQDGIKSGFGVLETGIEYEDGFPKIVLLHEDCLNIFPDPYSKKYDWSDARFVHRAKWVYEVDAIADFPGSQAVIRAASGADVIANAITSFKKENYIDANTKRIRLIETWYREKTKKKYAMIEGQAQDITDLPKKLAKHVGEVTEKTQEVIKQCIWCSGGVISKATSPYDHGMFPFIAYYCDRKKDGEPVGIIRALKSVQMEINKRRSKALHLLSTNRAIMEENAVQSLDDIREEMARPDGLLIYKRGYKFKTEANVELAQSQMALLEDSKNAIKRIAGADLGTRQEVRSNQQLQRKQAAEDIVIVDVFDNLRRTRKIVAKHIYLLVKQYYDKEMVFNVTDNLQQSKQVTLGQDHISAIKQYTFDTVVSDMPETTTIQQEQFTMIGDFLKSVNLPPNMAMAILPIMVRLSQIRDKKEILETLEQMKAPPPEEVKISLAMTWGDLDPEEKAQMATKMGLPELAQFEQQRGREPEYLVSERTKLKIAAIKSDTEAHKAETSGEDPEEKAQEMQIKAAEGEQKLSLKEREHQMKMQQQHESHQLKRVQSEDDMQFKRASAHDDLQIKRVNADHDIEHKKAAGEQDIKLKKEGAKLGNKNNKNKSQRNK